MKTEIEKQLFYHN